MDILRNVKNSSPINSKIVFALYILAQIQIINILIVKQKSKIFGQMLDYFESQQMTTPLVYTIFILNFLELIEILVIKFWLKNNKQKKNKITTSSFFKFLQIKPFLLFVTFTKININALKSAQWVIILIATFNLIFSIIELIAINFVNASYRFYEKNFIRKKNNIITSWIMIILVIFMTEFFSLTSGAVFLIIRAIIIIYENYQNLENHEIRKCQWIMPFISIEFGFLVITKQLYQFNFFSNLLTFLFIIFFSVYSSYSLTSYLEFNILKNHIEKSEQIFDGEKSDTIENSVQIIQLTPSELSDMLLQLRIMALIYESRLKYGSQQQSQLDEEDNYDNWWTLFDLFIMNHKIHCNNITCKCHQLKPRSPLNQELQNQVFSNKIYELILQAIKKSKYTNKLKIIENYFLVEIHNNPLKSYFQVIKLLQLKLNAQEILEAQNLIHEIRENFTQLFIKQKVKNSELDVEPLFQFQEHLKSMQKKLNEMALGYSQFYEIFANNFVQMQTLKQKTRKLNEYKRFFNDEIDTCLKWYDKSLELITFCVVYFRFFDEYSNKLQKVEQKAEQLILNVKENLKAERGKLDIYDSCYGAIKADLIFKPGKITAITKSMCYLLGYSYKELKFQRVNKIMPLMFAKNHDKFLRNFIEKSQMTILKRNEKMVFGKNSKRFIAPLTIKLKIDYSSHEGMFSVAFAKLAQTKSEFILLNNYGKVEEITEGIFNKFFKHALVDENRKVKKLCAGKFLLSFNCILKEVSETNDKVYEGVMLTCEKEETLMNYFSFPEFKKIYKGKSENEGESSNQSYKSITSSSNCLQGSDGNKSIDLSDDTAKYIVDLKQSLRVFFKSFDYREVTAHYVTYRCQDYVTKQFKCKVLEIISVRQELTGQNLVDHLKHQIQNVCEQLGFQESQKFSLKIFNEQFGSQKNESLKSDHLTHDEDIIDINNEEKRSEVISQKKDKTLKFIDAMQEGSQTSSALRHVQMSKKKQIISNSFGSKSQTNFKLQTLMTVLIIILALIMLFVCAFSVQIQSNYETLKNDNLLPINFRIEFLFLLGIQELNTIYKSYNIPSPAYIQQKRSIYLNAMQQHLIKSTKLIKISQWDYQNTLIFKQEDQKYQYSRTILSLMKEIYTTFIAAEEKSYYITQNYLNVSNLLLNLTRNEEQHVKQQSHIYITKIHIAVAFYSFMLIVIIVVGIWFRKIVFEKESKIIDFLPFLKSHHAKKNETFFEQFYEANKQAEEIDIQSVQKIAEKIILRSQHQREDPKNNKKKQKTTSNSRFMRIVKNQSNGFTFKKIVFSNIVLFLCLFVIFYSQFFFAQADRKFQTYLTLKNAAFTIQLIPSRSIVLYFSNINRVLHHQPEFNYTEGFYQNVHEKNFELMVALSKPDYYDSDMQQVITDHFSREICSLIECSSSPEEKQLLKDQQVFYLAYKFSNAFNYMRNIIKKLPDLTDPKEEVKMWIDQNNVFELLETVEHIFDLMKRSEEIITDLFTEQITQIGTVLFVISLTLIPILILLLVYLKRKYVEYVVERLQCTEQIFSHLSWLMLSQNNYAVNYFEAKTKKFKRQ